MEFLKYLKILKRDGALNDFAERCETTPGQLDQVARGYRRAGESLAINIERETNGKFKCEQFRPDVDWGYLRSTRSAAGTMGQ